MFKLIAAVGYAVTLVVYRMYQPFEDFRKLVTIRFQFYGKQVALNIYFPTAENRLAV